MIELILIAFIAGVMTVLAPCILPLLPIIVGGSVRTGEKAWLRPFVITGSLAVSVILFTLLLKFSTSLLGIPPQVWQVASGIIIVLLGIAMVWPASWKKAGLRLNLASNKLLGNAGKKQGLIGDILTGAALGPVFSSCSPTFAFIVATVLPATFAVGFLYLVTYAVGLSSILLLVALLGQKLIAKLQWASNPNGWFKRTIGILFIVVGLFIATGFDHKVQTFLVQKGWYDPFSQFEQKLLN